MVQLALATRRESDISNDFDDQDPLAEDVQLAISLRQKFPAATHRPTQATYAYNCHGLTFAARRTFIQSPAEVRRILDDDTYVRITEANDVLPGDIVIYVRDGEIDHSGIIIEVQRFEGMLVINPVILSKWGNCHEVIHRLKDCPYSDCSVEYYRIVK